MADDQPDSSSALDPPPHEWGSPPPPPQWAPPSQPPETGAPPLPHYGPGTGRYGQPYPPQQPQPPAQQQGQPHPGYPQQPASQHAQQSQRPRPSQPDVPGQPVHGHPVQGPQDYGQPGQYGAGQASHVQPIPGQAGGLSAPRQWNEPPAAERLPGQAGRQPPSGPSTRLPRLIAALAAALAAVLVTTYSTFWIWNKADALTPVDLPSANGTPLETVNPSAKPSPKPTPPPPPKGTIDGAFMVDYKGDRMPIMAAPWRKEKYEPITLGGVAQWLDVHVKYDGQSSWGNLAGFGLFDPENTTYKGKASLNYASRLVGGRMLNRLYQGKPVPIKSTVKHRDLTINGHPAHELIARIPVKQPKLKETYSQLAIIVIDRGDGTAVAAYGDFSGTTAARWLPIWRQHVAKIQIAS